MQLSQADKLAIEAQVAAFEQATGAQAVVSVVDRCDDYPELPWRAFALGVAIASLLLWSVPMSGALAHYSTTVLLVSVLSVGALAALCSIYFPQLGRWLLPLQRRAVEVRQYAQAMFLARELFATQDRCAVLVLVSLYEKQGVLVADRGLKARVDASQLASLESRLSESLTSAGPVHAVQEVLAKLIIALGRTETTTHSNDIPDTLVRERGH